MESGERGSFEIHDAATGIEGHFVPKEPIDDGDPGQHQLVSVKIIETDPQNGVVRIFPLNTLPGHPDYLGPKYTKIRAITLPFDDYEDIEIDLIDLLEDFLPSGFIRDPEYGLGLIKDYGVVIDLIEAHTDCDTLEFTHSQSTTVSGRTFRFKIADFEAIRSELNRIGNRGGMAIHRVKDALTHNALAEVLDLDEKHYSEGRHPTTKWMTKIAAGDTALTDREEEELLAAAAASAAELATRTPHRVVRLQRDIELVNLDQLLRTYEAGLDAGHNEPWWQRYFEENVFVLQLLFGGPTVFVSSQVPIGKGGNSAKGKKIADYLFQSPTTNNAALVEIKRPSTRLMNARAYREGVYGVSSEITKSVTQVLDQALQLTKNEKDTQARTPGASWVSTAPRCFVVAGRTDELTTADKQKSFELFREHLSGVRVVTYDELFRQLQLLRDYLAPDDDLSAPPASPGR
ncbi:DUF4263 domain-containing protein [Kribbella sp. NBC_01510]|uniref:Shedu immune nuclease family protein n=1 Tax=Kribbella sp. NBC_01510 TaxID=2903581 RepID=UPI00386643E2